MLGNHRLTGNARRRADNRWPDLRGPGRCASHLASAPREAHRDRRSGDPGERQRRPAPTLRPMRQAGQVPHPALALLLKTHNRSPATTRRILHTLNPDALADVDQPTRSPAKWSIYRATGDTLG